MKVIYYPDHITFMLRCEMNFMGVSGNQLFQKIMNPNEL